MVLLNLFCDSASQKVEREAEGEKNEIFFGLKELRPQDIRVTAWFPNSVPRNAAQEVEKKIR